MTQQWNSSSEDDVQMPLGVGGETGFEPEGISKPKMNGPTLVLFVAFAVALMVIYLVGLQNKPRSASAAQLAHEQEVQTAIEQLLQKNGKANEFNGLFQDTDKLVRTFYSYLGSQKDNVPELTHDPFGSDDVKPVVAAVGEEPVVVPVNTVEAEKLRKVAETFAGLKLQSVMVGRTSAAMVNNRMVTVGAHLGELTVASIEPGRVVLNYGKNKFELKLTQPDAGPQ